MRFADALTCAKVGGDSSSRLYSGGLAMTTQTEVEATWFRQKRIGRPKESALNTCQCPTGLALRLYRNPGDCRAALPGEQVAFPGSAFRDLRGTGTADVLPQGPSGFVLLSRLLPESLSHRNFRFCCS